MYVRPCPAGRPSGVTLRVKLCNTGRKMNNGMLVEIGNGFSGVIDGASDGFSIQFDAVSREMENIYFQAL